MATRTRCFFDVSINSEPAARIVIELYDEKVPKTVDNFKHLCLGDKGFTKTGGIPLHYKGSPFHRIIKGFMIQGGDFTAQNGTGGESIYGEKFEDEALDGQHDRPGLLSMANAGPNTNGSQFFITTAPAPHLNGKHVVFGKVIGGMNVVRTIEHLPKDTNDAPKVPVTIASCGTLSPEETIVPFPIDATGDPFPEYPEDYLGTDINVIQISQTLKNIGTELYKKGDYLMAFEKFSKGLRYLENDQFVNENKQEDIQQVMIALLLNKAACGLKIGKYQETIQSASDVLETRSSNKQSDRTKALFRRAMAFNALNDTDRALKDLWEAEKMDPTDPAIKREIESSLLRQRKSAEKEKKMYAKMFA